MGDGTLLVKTRDLLNNRPRSLTMQDIVNETDISLRTLGRIAAGSHERPCVNAIQTLYEFLSGRKLDV